MALLNYPKFKAFYPSSNLPLAGGLLNTYVAGSVNTPLAAYTDVLCTVAAANPIVLDSNGEALIYLKGAYKLVLTDSNSNVIWTIDNVVGIGAQALVSIASYGNNLATALAAIGSTPATLLIDGTVTLGANATVSATTGLQVVQGGSFTGAYSLTINGPFSCPSGVQAFNGPTVAFGSGTLASSPDQSWFANAATGANASLSSLIPTVSGTSFSASAKAPLYKTGNGGAATLANITNGVTGQNIALLINDSNTTIDFVDGNLRGGPGTNAYAAQSGDVLTGIYGSDSNWHLILIPISPQVHNVTASRALGTVYQNLTGKVMSVLVIFNTGSVPSGCYLQVFSDTSAMPATYGSSSITVSTQQAISVQFLVPPNYYYKVIIGGTAGSNTSLVTWDEIY